MGFFSSFIAAFIISMLISAAVRLVAAEDSQFDEDDVRSRGILANAKTTDWHIPLIYGKCRVGVNWAYVGTTGEDNKYLHIVGVIGEGPINGIVQEGGVDQLFLDGHLWTDWGAEYVHYEVFLGTTTQNVCATLHSAIPEWTDPLRNTAYIYVRLKYDQDKWVKKPDITVTVEGLKVYDPTDEITAYSNNAALATYNMITRSSKRGGMGIGSARIAADALDAAKDYCTAKGWTANLVINENNSVSDNIQLVLNCFRGAIIYSENLFKVRFRDMNYEDTGVMTFTEDDILEDSPLVVRPNANLFSRPNCVKVIFFNSAKKYVEDSYSFPDSVAIAADGDYREREIKLLGLSTLDKVQPMAYYYLERWRWGNIGEFGTVSKAMSLEPYDLIQVTHGLPGWADQDLRVLAPSINLAGEVQLSCIEEKSALYDDEYNPPPASEWHETTLPDPLEVPWSVINVSHAEEVYYYRDRSFTRWKIDFDPPAPEDYPWWDYAEIWVKIGTGEYRYMTKSTSDYVLDPVEEGETYYVKLRSVSIHMVKEDFDSAYTVSKTIVGKTTLPTDLDSMTAVANGDTVTIFADASDDPDISGYEVRLGDSWDGAIFISFNKAPSIRLVGVRPGTHTFWMSPKDNAGNYSDNPVSASVTVFVPPGYSELATYGSWAWDFTTGTYDNTEHVTYDAEDALKCSHTGDVLSGTWESPTYDLGAVETVRLWGDFRHSFVSSDTTWDGVAPSPVTWADLGADTKSWQEIFSPVAAGIIQARLKYSNTDADWDTASYFDFFEILCAEVQSRYVRVVITITDPTLDANLYLRELNMSAYEGPQ